MRLFKVAVAWFLILPFWVCFGKPRRRDRHTIGPPAWVIICVEANGGLCKVGNCVDQKLEFRSDRLPLPNRQPRESIENKSKLIVSAWVEFPFCYRRNCRHARDVRHGRRVEPISHKVTGNEDIISDKLRTISMIGSIEQDFA